MILLNMEVHRVSYSGDSMIQLTEHLQFIASFKRQKYDFLLGMCDKTTTYIFIHELSIPL